MNKPHLSPSQVRMMDFCPQQWKFRYVDGLKTPPGFVLVEGSATHKAAEVNNLQKITSHEDLPVSVLQEAAVSEVEKRVNEEGLELSSDEKSVGVARTVDSIKDSVAFRLVPLYHAFVAPLIQPAFAEEKITIELPNHSHDLLGIIDVATTDGVVRDLKVTGRSKGQGEADSSLQLTWYHVAYQYKTGAPPKEVGLDVLVKTKVPKTQYIRSDRTDEDVDVLLKRVNHTITQTDLIVRGEIEPSPAPLNHPMCSPKFCGYYSICPWVNKRRRWTETGGNDE